jgi:LPS-assembly lipoprotein
MKKIIASCLIAFTLSACGWHIRGAMEMPKNLSQLYVTAIDSKGALITELRQLLKTNRVSLVTDSEEANYSLYILEETKDRRSAGVGGDALSSSYEITLKANYEIQLKGSTETTKATAISVRSFNYYTESINSATQEEILLDQEMRRDLAQQMLRRLNAAISNPNSTAEKHSSKTKSGKAKPLETKSDATNETLNGKTVNGKTAP